MIKKILFLTLIIIVFNLCFCLAANPKVQLNGTYIDFTDENGNKVEAQLVNNRTMVPLRKIFQLLGCEIEWDQETKTVTAHSTNKTIKLTIGEEKAYIIENNNSKEITLDSAPVIIENRTLVPLRFISESLGRDVGWDQKNQTAVIIDYNGLSNVLLEKSSNLYKMFELKPGQTQQISITKKYSDLANSSRNYTDVMTIRAKTIDDNTMEGNIIFTGNSDLAKEIINEEWNDISFTMTNNGKEARVTTPNYAFSRMLGGEKNKEFPIEGKKLRLVFTNNFGEYFKELFKIDTTSINVNTYSNMKNDLNKLFGNFMANGKKKISTAMFSYSNLDLKDFYDITNKNSALNVLLLVNKAIFSYSLDVNDLLSDFPDATYEFIDDSTNNSSRIIVNLKNEYKEAYEIQVEIKNNI